jgi:signal peptidase II
MGSHAQGGGVNAFGNLDCARRKFSVMPGSSRAMTTARRAARSESSIGMLRNYLYGPFTPLGLAVALVVCALDQASKLYLLFVFDLERQGPVRLGPFFDLVLTRNTGISYGLFQTHSALGQGLLLATKLLAVLLLWIWLARASGRLAALSLGLIVGGAAGNAIDRLAYGWVADFVFFHIKTATWRFDWYVFNLADVAIVAGVIGLLYESLIGDRAVKAP